jgi:PRTRC genetic system protein C
MALVKEELKRVFVYNGKRLNDPNSSLTPSEVMDFHSDEFPELVNATMRGPSIKNEVAEFVFEVKFKEKG